VIEYAFAELSAQIGRSVVARGWVAENALVHYALHAELDQRHAEEFFALVEDKWSDSAKRELIERGLALGAHIFDRLYRELSALEAV
jgi:pyrroloquinoline-quinone synthase